MSATIPTPSANPAPKNVCKFGLDCIRADCYFTHPNGRLIDASPAPPAATQTSAPVSTVILPATSSPAVGETSTQSASNDGSDKACRWGTDCTNVECGFKHATPDGKSPQRARQIAQLKDEMSQLRALVTKLSKHLEALN